MAKLTKRMRLIHSSVVKEKKYGVNEAIVLL
ncbi:hypothetical protein Rin_00007890, partial [Candidatus Regiella insecticola 5.15]